MICLAIDDYLLKKIIYIFNFFKFEYLFIFLYRALPVKEVNTVLK